MPPIDPAVLKKRTTALAGMMDNPAALAAGVRALLDDYADRTHRPSPKLVSSGGNNTFKTPPPVLRTLTMALRAPARAAGEGALPVVAALWAGGSREERHLAAELLGEVALSFPGQALELVETLLSQIDGGETADALAEHGLAPLIMANPAAFLEHARRWVTHPHKWARRLGVAVLLPLARDRHWDNVPGALSVINLVITEPDGEVRRATAAVLEHLARKRPGEIARFLREQAVRANSNSGWVIRTVLTVLEPDEQADIIRVLRG